jgi:hypothetical protein
MTSERTWLPRAARGRLHTATDLRSPRARVSGWKDGHTSALPIWRGGDGPARPEDPGSITIWKRTITDERDALDSLVSLSQHDDTGGRVAQVGRANSVPVMR